MRLFVNNRAIKDRLLMHGVGEGLRSFLLKGKSPAGIIAVEIDPELVDVNVHPAKQEVRFRDSRTIHQRVCDAVRNAMLDHQQRIRQDMFSHRGQEQGNPEPHAADTEWSEQSDRGPHSPRSAALSAPSLFRSREPGPEPYHANERESLAAEPPAQPAEPIQVEDLILIGCFQDLYILCRNHDRLVVIDQHAAHERLLYEELRSQYLDGRVASQNLLFPVSLELTPFQAQIVETNLDSLGNMGFGIRDFGGTTWILSAVPALGSSTAPQEIFLDVLEQFGSNRATGGGDHLDTIIATMACKAAVKSGDQLSDQEIRALLVRMSRADLFSHCPHGRPVVKIFNQLDIKNWFHRT
jgi:DNA mismatch repair protein MutL